HRRAEPHGDVVGEVVAADTDDGRVPEASALVDGDVRRAAADVHEGDAKLLLVLGQHGLAGGQLLDDGFGDVHTSAVHAGDDVLRGALATGHDVHVDLE